MNGDAGARPRRALLVYHCFADLNTLCTFGLLVRDFGLGITDNKPIVYRVENNKFFRIKGNV